MIVITVARKPLEGSVATNVQRWGTGALNIDACRLEIGDTERAVIDSRSGGTSVDYDWQGPVVMRSVGERYTSHVAGRWPSNFILQGDCSVRELNNQSGVTKNGGSNANKLVVGLGVVGWCTGSATNYAGGASRFFKQVTR